eukprot:COSAG02_NODE_14210_length_1297_cov_0.964942_3_plen_68_part_00
MIAFRSSTLYAQASRSLWHIVLYKNLLHLADWYLLPMKDASLFTMLHANEELTYHTKKSDNGQAITW